MVLFCAQILPETKNGGDNIAPDYTTAISVM